MRYLLRIVFHSFYFFPIYLLYFHRPTNSFIWTVKKKRKIQSHCKAASTLIYKHAILSYCLNLSILRFCSLFRHLIVLLIDIILPTDYILQTKREVSSLFSFFARPTHPPSLEGGRWETKHFIWWTVGAMLTLKMCKTIVWRNNMVVVNSSCEDSTRVVLQHKNVCFWDLIPVQPRPVWRATRPCYFTHITRGIDSKTRHLLLFLQCVSQNNSPTDKTNSN